jgi:hypothetical protein
MKRAAIIVGVVLSIAVVVGAFIVGGGDNSSEAKGGDKATSLNAVKEGTDNLENANQVASGGPLKPGDKSDEKSDDEGKPGKYEIKKAAVGVNPSTLRLGKELKVKVSNFQPGEQVLIAITPKGGGTALFTKQLKVGKNNRGELEIGEKALQKAGLTVGLYTVSATGLTSGGSASTNLTVVNKKS